MFVAAVNVWLQFCRGTFRGHSTLYIVPLIPHLTLILPTRVVITKNNGINPRVSTTDVANHRAVDTGSPVGGNIVATLDVGGGIAPRP